MPVGRIPAGGIRLVQTMTKEMGKRTNQKLIRRMHEVLFEHGFMTANELSVKIYDLYPRHKRFHRNSMTSVHVMSQLMTGRPKMFIKGDFVYSNRRACRLWGALQQEEEE